MVGLYALDADARSRLNTVFMGSMLMGGAFGAGAAAMHPYGSAESTSFISRSAIPTDTL